MVPDVDVRVCVVLPLVVVVAKVPLSVTVKAVVPLVAVVSKVVVGEVVVIVVVPDVDVVS